MLKNIICKHGSLVILHRDFQVPVLQDEMVYRHIQGRKPARGSGQKLNGKDHTKHWGLQGHSHSMGALIYAPSVYVHVGGQQAILGFTLLYFPVSLASIGFYDAVTYV